MNSKRIISFIFFVIITVNTLSISSLAHPGRTDANGGHWNRKTGTYHYHNNGSKQYASGGGSGSTGYSYPSATEKTGKELIIRDRNTYYYNHNQGCYCTGFYNLNEKWCYFGEQGKMYSGWANINGYVYLFDATGQMITGQTEVSEKVYVFNDFGKMTEGDITGLQIPQSSTNNTIPEPPAGYNGQDYYFAGAIYKETSYDKFKEANEFGGFDSIYIIGTLYGGIDPNKTVTLEVTLFDPDGDADIKLSNIKSGEICKIPFITPIVWEDDDNYEGSIEVVIEETGELLTFYDFEIVPSDY